MQYFRHLVRERSSVDLWLGHGLQGVWSRGLALQSCRLWTGFLSSKNSPDKTVVNRQLQP